MLAPLGKPFPLTTSNGGVGGSVLGGRYRVYVGAVAQAPQNSWVISNCNIGWCVMHIGVILKQRAYPSINKLGSDKAKNGHNSLTLEYG